MYQISPLNINSSVIRQKGESQNGSFKKTKHAKFSEKRTFFTPRYAHERRTSHYCQPPTNIIVKHIDRRIRGKTRDGQLIYNADFTPACYHPIKSHIATHIVRKNSCYSGNLYIKSQVLERVEQNYVNMITVENSFNIVVE